MAQVIPFLKRLGVSLMKSRHYLRYRPERWTIEQIALWFLVAVLVLVSGLYVWALV